MITNLTQYLSEHAIHGPLKADSKTTDAYRSAHEIAMAVADEPEMEEDEDIDAVLKVLYELYGNWVEQKVEAEQAASAPAPLPASKPAPVPQRPKSTPQPKPQKPPAPIKAKAPKEPKPGKKVKTPVPAPPKAKAKAAPKAKKSKPTPPGRAVPMVAPAVRIIQKFLALANKEVPRAKVELLYRSMQQAATTKRVTKRSPHAELILKIAEYLYEVINNSQGAKTVQIQLEPKQEQKLLAVANSQHQSTAVVLLNTYIKMTREGAATKQAIGNLLGRLQVALDSFQAVPKKNPYRPALEQLRKLLEQKMENPGGKRMIATPMELRGLDGLAGLDDYSPTKVSKPTCVPNGVASAADLAAMEIDVMHLPGKLGKLLGPIASSSKILLSCPPGQGKTMWALDLAATLADMGKNVLFVSAEEFGSPTLSAKLNMLSIPAKRGSDIHFTETLEAYNSNYDVVLVDSVQKAKLSIEKFNEFRKSKAGQNTMMVLISQVTKDGKARGSNEWPHDVDVVVELDKGRAFTTKNRFANLAEVKVR